MKVDYKGFTIEFTNAGKVIYCSRIDNNFFNFEERVIKKYFGDKYILCTEPITLGGKIHQILCFRTSSSFYECFSMDRNKQRNLGITKGELIENCQELQNFKKLVDESELKNGYSVQVLKNGEMVQEFKSVKEARQQMGFTPNGIDRAIRDGFKTKGYEIRLISNF